MANEDQDQLKLKDIADGHVVLPGGYVDAAGKVHDRAELREMTGEEEDILAMPKISGSEKISRIIGNCLVKLGDLQETIDLSKLAKKLTIGDRVVIMLTLRAVSLGPIYPFSTKCPACEEEVNRGVNLTELKVQNMKNKAVREQAVTLPSGKKCVLRVMTGEDEERVGRVNRKGSDALSLAMLARVKSIEGVEAPSVQAMKRLGIKDRNAIRDWYKSVEGGVDTDLEIVCECGNTFESVLDIGQPSFFFPKASEEMTTSP